MAGLRMTVGVLTVLGALLDRSDTEPYGLEIVRASGLEPGTISPILQRLRGAGWVSDRWEDPEPGRIAGRPLRRYDQLTVEGRARALRRGRDRSGLSRLLASPASLPLPRPRQARHERSQGTCLRGQQILGGIGLRERWATAGVCPVRAWTQFTSLGAQPVAQRGGHGLLS